MDDRDQSSPDPTGYEPPCVEREFTPADLEHEILYAGQDTSLQT
jgi:hypothetical protein